MKNIYLNITTEQLSTVTVITQWSQIVIIEYNHKKIYSRRGSIGSIYGMLLIHQQKADETHVSDTQYQR